MPKGSLADSFDIDDVTDMDEAWQREMGRASTKAAIHRTQLLSRISCLTFRLAMTEILLVAKANHAGGHF